MGKDEKDILNTAKQNHNTALQILNLLKTLESSGMLQGELVQCLKDAELIEKEARAMLESLQRDSYA